MQCFSFSALCKCLNPLKLRGYSFESIFSCMICLPFLGLKTVHSMTGSILSSHIEARKDAFYRLKNNPGICWRMILWLFASKFIKLTGENGGRDSNEVRCLVFDDSTLPKTGRYIEKVSKVWDHVLNRCILGYKLLEAISNIVSDYLNNEDIQIKVKSNIRKMIETNCSIYNFIRGFKDSIRSVPMKE